VPCAHDTTGHPSIGAGPDGTITNPVTCTGWLAGDDCDQYFTKYLVPLYPGATTFAAIKVPGVVGNDVARGAAAPIG
jgi:hypothetical protein